MTIIAKGLILLVLVSLAKLETCNDAEVCFPNATLKPLDQRTELVDMAVLSQLKRSAQSRNRWRYQTFGEIEATLRSLQAAHKTISQIVEIGQTVLGRKLTVIRIRPGSGNTLVWIDGGVIAREWISVSSVLYIIKELLSDANIAKDKVLGTIEWHILTVVNPDGYEYSHQKNRFWKKNRSKNGPCYGVDLNKNFDIFWGEAGPGENPCSEKFGGIDAQSEKESIAISNYITMLEKGFRAAITFRSFNQMVLTPWAFTRAAPKNFSSLIDLANRTAKAMGAFGAEYTTGSYAKMKGYSMGSFADWAKAEGQVPLVYTIFLRDKGKYGYLLPASQIEISGKEALAGVKIIAAAATEVNLD